MPERCVDNCPVLPRVEALERSNEQHGSTHREIFDRLRAVETSEAVQEATLAAINGKLDKLIEWQEAEQDKPNKLVDKLKENVVWMLLAAVIGWVLARFGV